MKLSCFTLQRIIPSAALAMVFSGPVLAEEYFERYGLSPASPTVDIGVQPLAYPDGVLSSVLRRDGILINALAELKQPLKTHAFKRGGDMLALLADHRLESATLGDMPTIRAASTGDIWIIGLVEQSRAAIVAKGDTSVEGLVGKRIGYVEASTSHHTLLQGLAAAGIGENQIKLVSLPMNEMPDALARGDIDAFSGWEPAVSNALSSSEKHRIVFTGMSMSCFVIEQDFARRSPQAALHLVAGLLRAVEWMRRSQRNVEKAVRWAMADTEAFSGKAETLPPAAIVAITRRNLLDIASAPIIAHNPTAPALKAEFEFLRKLGKLPANTKWENIAAAFTYNGVAQVMAESKKFQINTFDYPQ